MSMNYTNPDGHASCPLKDREGNNVGVHELERRLLYEMLTERRDTVLYILVGKWHWLTPRKSNAQMCLYHNVQFYLREGKTREQVRMETEATIARNCIQTNKESCAAQRG